MGGEGSLVDGKKADGRRECDLDCEMFDAFLVRVGNGKLLKVLLLGMPPMGSSGRQT